MSVFLSNWEMKPIKLWLLKMYHYKDKSKSERANKAKTILQLKHKMIGNGRNRIVYDLNNGYVLKIAITKWGIQNNKTEFKIYKHCPVDLREHLCLVKEAGHGWIIMEKMQVEVPDEIYDKGLIKLKNKFLDARIKPKDMWKSNMRLSKKGKITVVDYGNFIMY
ncbi:hypothetical protein [Priestia megaterium]|uniref:hypothetical protein n=1 Tax=Priestia megaterium TaxID=1404 RepID=UPI000BF715DB|nr:hypothetical protein [Priestia megaterium]PFI91726.1 hypothetical protein COI84_21140 [Priestia megaterium]PGR04680.1 hypothetical protein COC62_29930 [Priestia megaterium]